jgi:hypothetical protein
MNHILSPANPHPQVLQTAADALTDRFKLPCPCTNQLINQPHLALVSTALALSPPLSASPDRSAHKAVLAAVLPLSPHAQRHPALSGWALLRMAALAR